MTMGFSLISTSTPIDSLSTSMLTISNEPWYAYLAGASGTVNVTTPKRLDSGLEESAGFLLWASKGMWEVYADYEVLHGVLRPVGDLAHRYLPPDHREIVDDIAKLHEGDDSGLLAFARTWGLLGYRGDPREGDPVPWVWAHSRNIRMVLDLTSICKRVTGRGWRSSWTRIEP